VLCVAGRTGLDEAAAAMLAQILLKHGLRSRVAGAEALSAANISRLETEGVTVACLSLFDVSSPAQMRFIIRRLRRKLPSAKIILACWMAEAESDSLAGAVKADALTTTMRNTVKLCLQEAGQREFIAPDKPLLALAAAAS
jgi:hypothetical protein